MNDMVSFLPNEENPHTKYSEMVNNMTHTEKVASSLLARKM